MGRLSTLGLSGTGTSAALIAVATVVGLHAGGQAGVGTLRGIVTASNPPAAPVVTVTQDDVVCGKTQPDPSLVVGAGGALANAVVILSGTKAGSSDAATVVNKQCRFVPHVQVAAPGKTLKIGSEDSVLHTTHAYAEDERSLFNVAIPIPGVNVMRPIEKAKVVRLQCDTHPWMRGYVIVTDERTAISGLDGRFQIDQVPAGTYDVRVWHSRLKAPPQKVTVGAGATAEVAFNVVP